MEPASTVCPRTGMTVQVWHFTNNRLMIFPEETTMTTQTNYSTAVMLFDDRIRAIKTLYNPKEPNGTRKVFKTLDKDIKVDDYVVVPSGTRHGMTVVKVEEVDVEIDFNSREELRWVISRIDFASHEKVIAEEQTWIDSIKASEKLKKKNEIRDNMAAMLKEGGVDVIPPFGATLSLANHTVDGGEKTE